MNLLSDFVSGVLRTTVKLALYMLTALFLIIVLAIALSVAVFALLFSLLSGRKPAFVTHFTRFRQAVQPFGPKTWSGQSSRSKSDNAEVVDVQAREVRAVLAPNNQSKPSE